MKTTLPSSLLRLAAVLLLGGITGTAAAQDEDKPQLDQVHLVNCQVGLVVHAKPDDQSRRVGSLENGKEVRLAGEKVRDQAPGGPLVEAIVVKDAKDPGLTWIKIKKPLEGFVLYQTAKTGNSEEYSYLKPIFRE